MGLTLFKGKEKSTAQVSRKEEDLLGKVASTEVWRLSPDATASFVRELISLMLSVPFARDLHMRTPPHLPERINLIIETLTTKVTELEVKYNSLIPSIELYYHLGCIHYNLQEYAKAENYFSKATKVDERDFKSLLGLGLTQMELNRDTEALETMKKLIELEPDNEVSWYSLGLLLYKLKKHNEELECYERAIAINRKYEPAWNNRGLTLYELGRYGEAAENFAEALKLNPKNEKFWHGIGLVHIKLNELETALKDFETAIQVNPEYAEAWYSRALVLYLQNRGKEAIGVVEKALEIRKNFRDALILKGKILEKMEKYTEALAVFEEVITHWPESPEAYIGKAEVLVKLGNTKDALTAIDTAIKYSESAQAYIVKGNILRKYGNFEDAAKQYLRALEREKADYRVMQLAGETLFEAGKYREASELFKKILSVKVNSHEAWFWKGKCDLKSNAIDDGIHAIEMAISLSPKNADYIRFMINTAKHLGKREIYLKYEEMLTQVEHDNPDVWFEKASAYFENGKLSEAVHSLEKALALRRDHLDALLLLGKIMYHQKNYQRAIEVLENAIEINNADFSAWLLMATVKNEMGEFSDAIICAERALELKEDAEGYYQYGLALKGLEKFGDAGKAFTRSFELDSTFIKSLVARGEVLEKLNSHESAMESYLLAYQKSPSLEILSKLIQIAERTGRLDDAIRFVEEGLKKDNKNPELYLAYGRILGKKGREKEAIGAFEEGLKVAPENLGLLSEVFNAYSKAGRYEDAIKIGLKLVEINEFPELWYMIGNNLVNIGKFERALECYQQCLELKPDFVHAYLARGKIFEGRGDTESAEKEYRKAIEVQPEGYEANFALAVLLKNRKEFTQALEYIEKALAARTTAEGFIEKGRILVALGKLEESVKAYEQAFNLSQKIPEILYEKAKVLRLLGLIPSAIEMLEKNLELHPHLPTSLELMELLENTGSMELALKECDKAIKNHGEKLELLVMREKLLLKAGKLEELLEHYNQILVKSREPETLFKKTELLWKLKRYAEAREAVEELLTMQKKPEYFLLHARIVADEGSIEGALSVVSRGLRAFKNNSELLMEKGRLLILAGNFEDAEKILTEIIENNQNLTALHYLADLKIRRNAYQEAVEILERIKKIEPNAINALILLGNAYFQLHNYVKALENYTAVLEQSENLEVRENIGRIYLATRKYEEALKHAEILIKNKPENVKYWLMKGEALRGLKRYIYALETYNKALKIHQRAPELWFGRGVVLANIGDLEEAIRSVEKAIEFESSTEALKLRAKLLVEIGKYEAALAAYQEIPGADDDVECLLYRGIALAKKGDESASAIFKSVLSKDA
ncbi:MAG: tetratricopeptide repeat protein, partial [Thermoplasmata archaeon]